MRIDPRYVLVMMVGMLDLVFLTRADLNMFTFWQFALSQILFIVLAVILFGWYYIIPLVVTALGKKYYWGEYKIVDNKFIIVSHGKVPMNLEGMVVLEFLPSTPVVMMDNETRLQVLAQISQLAGGEGEIAFIFNKVKDVYGARLYDELMSRLRFRTSLTRRSDDPSIVMLKETLSILGKYPTTQGHWFIVLRDYDISEFDLRNKLANRAQSVISNLSGIGRVRWLEGEDLRVVLAQTLFGQLAQRSPIG